MKRIQTAWFGMMFMGLATLATPASALTDMDGKPVNIKSLTGKGKWSVAEVWASDCRMCQLSIQHIVNFKAKHPDVGIFGISMDGISGKANAQRFIDDQELRFPNLLSDKEEMNQYLFDTAGKGFVGTPTFLFYNPDGKLVTVQARALTEKELSRFIDSREPQKEEAEAFGGGDDC